MPLTRSQSTIILSISILMASCASSPHSTTEKYYLVVSNVKSPFWGQVTAGLYQAARELKVTAAIVGPDTYDPAGQKREFKRIAATSPAGMLVSVSDAKLMTEDINAAVAAGIPVLTVDADAAASKRVCFIGTNNYEAGQMGGRAAAKELNGKGNVVALLTAGQANMEERLSGYRSVFEAYPQIKIVEVIDLKGDPRVAFDRAKEILDQGKPVVDAFVSMDGQSPKEVAEVLSRKKARKVVIAMDALPPTLEGIENGWITATVAQKPFTMGYTSLRMAADLYLNKLPTLAMDFAGNPHATLPRFVDTGAAVLDKGNLAGYREAGKAAGEGK